MMSLDFLHHILFSKSKLTMYHGFCMSFFPSPGDHALADDPQKPPIDFPMTPYSPHSKPIRLNQEPQEEQLNPNNPDGFDD